MGIQSDSERRWGVGDDTGRSTLRNARRRFELRRARRVQGVNSPVRQWYDHDFVVVVQRKVDDNDSHCD